MFRDGSDVWKNIFFKLQNNGTLESPRGQRTLEIENACFEFHPLKDVYCSFDSRKLSLRYAFAELAWYITGDRDDTRIEKYSSIWATLKNSTSPTYYSNYGYYVFTEKQLQNCAYILKNDKDSRQACIMINRPEVSLSNSKDKLCTNSIMFRIRNNKLNMTVQMRSNDVIYGLGYDAIMFSLFYEILYLNLLETYPELQHGIYFHTAASFHIYEKHWSMMERIVADDHYEILDIPKLSLDEVKLLDEVPRIESGINVDIPHNYKFLRLIYDTFNI